LIRGSLASSVFGPPVKVVPGLGLEKVILVIKEKKRKATTNQTHPFKKEHSGMSPVLTVRGKKLPLNKEHSRLAFEVVWFQ